MKSPMLPLGLATILLTTLTFAAAVKDREAAVRDDKSTMEKDTRWIYNDVQKGFMEAKWKGKPLLVVLRCVPCLSCAGIDASVVQEPELAPLLDQFVCVRVINANALDLSLFQFDYDLSFSTLIFNGDGTVYGRYGSWRHQKEPPDKTRAGKQGGPMPYKTPVEFPSLSGKYQPDLDRNVRVVASCVHCHQIGDAFRV